MPNWGVNERKQAAKEREQQKQDTKKAIENKTKQDAEWKITDKEELKTIERREKEEKRKQEEYEKKQENKKLYEEDMERYQSNKGATSKKMTRAEIQKQQQQLLLKSLAKKAAPQQGNLDSEEEEEEKHEFDSDEENEYRYKLKPNVNHLMREQAEIDEEEFADVIDARGLDEALGKLGDNQLDKHPEKRARAAFVKYQDEQMPILKAENPSLKRSQLLDILHRNWKKAPENPFNQAHLEFNEKQ